MMKMIMGHEDNQRFLYYLEELGFKMVLENWSSDDQFTAPEHRRWTSSPMFLVFRVSTHALFVRWEFGIKNSAVC